MLSERSLFAAKSCNYLSKSRLSDAPFLLLGLVKNYQSHCHVVLDRYVILEDGRGEGLIVGK